MISYLLRHLQVFFYTLGQLARAPIASLMTIAVIAITLALPTGLYLLIENVQRMSTALDGGAKISLFLKADIDDTAAAQLTERIRQTVEVATVEYISPKQAMAEFKRLSGFGETLDTLTHNPLPPVLIVQPSATLDTPQKLDDLVKRLRTNGEVDLAQLDLQWVKRLHGLLQIARRGVWVLSVSLALAVVLIIGNTIRLAVLSRREEIEVTKLVGGTNAFIRRPFLYTGLLQGAAGALAAWALVSLCLSLLAGPIGAVAELYASNFRAEGLGSYGIAILVGVGAVLGWLGSRIAVGRHLGSLEPR
ncbi:MAG: cell division protein FtsX [Proteobacteria bacterium]|nr:MAG: cell division protein FtsX [Pseudomonadota bacterium]TDJ71958.1 MAG: cell division protein FtsX [Pseudomonadota bacterium]